MPTPKFTPGPWHKFRLKNPTGGEPAFRIDADGPTLFLHVEACSDGYCIGQNEANANLIAAAPALYGVAEAVAAHFADTDSPLGIAARAALAAAHGEGK